jgi:amidohydrolase
MNQTTEIQKLVYKEHNLCVKIRQHLHKNPELSFKEFNTSAYIKSLLNDWGINYIDGFVKTGIKVELSNGTSKKELALRADMDALPIKESSNKNYCSSTPGVMHACGHDAHTASLLVSLKILHENRHLWQGKITAIFQPGEELLPGGAKLMLEEGVFSKQPDWILGQHVYPDLPAGTVGIRSGQYMASCDEIHISLKGQGGHAALPHKVQDTVLATAQLINNMQAIVSRKISPYTPAVLSFGYIKADGATNIIPNEVNIQGTLRCMDEEWRSVAHQEMQKIARSLEISFGVTIDLDIRLGYPSLINHPEYTEQAKKWAEEYLGKENVIDLDLRMTAEDFSYYSQVMPATFYRFGTAEKGQESEKRLHHPEFDINEESLKTSVGMMTYLSIKYLSE